MDKQARVGAVAQWSAHACGELEGDKDQIDYFLGVEEDRYSIQPWMKQYFSYDKYKDKKVLEIGIGQGTDLMQFARGGAECYGVDITDNHLNLTRQNFDLQGKSVNLQKADAVHLPFPDNSIDCIYSFGVIHHIPEAKQVVSEIFRVLKPGGLVLTAFYYKWSAFHIFIKLLCHGFRCGWLFSKGYSGLLATIEDGADGVAIKPYVKLYTKGDVRKLFHAFSIENISVHQLKADHFYPRLLEKLVSPFINGLENKLGWYVACQARKR